MHHRGGVYGGAKLVQEVDVDAAHGVAGCPGSPWEGPALLRVAPWRYAERSSVGGPCGPTGSTMARWSNRRFWGFLPFSALVETIALAIHLQDMDTVCEPVQQSPGQAL